MLEKKMHQQIQSITRLAMKSSGAEQYDMSRYAWITRMEISELKKYFEKADPKKFLTDGVLASKLEFFSENAYKLREILPEGLRITVTATPCNINGVVFNKEDFNNETQHPYLVILSSDGSNDSGLCTGFGGIMPAPYLKIFPPEIIEGCSFIVHYLSIPKNLQDPTEISQLDYSYIASNLKKVFAHLQHLIK